MYLFDGIEGSQQLQPIYKELNTKYFGNSLPNIKVAWDGRLKKAIGRARVKYRTLIGSRPEINMGSLGITMSKSFDLSYEDLSAVMLHEMVHIELYIAGQLSKHHGTSLFDGQIRRLRKESGLNVPMKESSFKTSPKAAAKEGYLAVVHAGSGTGICVYSTPFIKKNWRQLVSFLGEFIPSGKVRKMELWKVNHPIIKNSTGKRSLRQVSWSPKTTEEVEGIKKSGVQWAEFGAGIKWERGKTVGL